MGVRVSGVQNLGTALSNAGSVFGAAGVPFAPILSGVGGLIGSAFGVGESPFVPNPLPILENPYAPQGLLWGLPVDPASVAVWAEELPVQGSTTWAPAVPGAPPGASVWLPEWEARGGFHGFDLEANQITRVLHHDSSGQGTNNPAAGGAAHGRYSNVKAHGSAFAQPWGTFGDDLEHPEVINGHIQRILDAWEAVNSPDFEPEFWDVDYRTWPQYLRAEFAKQPLNTINWFLFRANGDIGLAGELWYAQSPNGAWSEWYQTNQEMPAKHLERTQEWLAWRAQLALEAQLAASIEEAQEEAAAEVIAQYTNAINPETDPTPPSVPAPTPVSPSNPAPILTPTIQPSSIAPGSGAGGVVMAPQVETPSVPAPLILGGLAALALLIA